MYKILFKEALKIVNEKRKQRAREKKIRKEAENKMADTTPTKKPSITQLPRAAWTDLKNTGKPKSPITAENAGSLNGLYLAVIIVHILDWVIFKFAINTQTIIARALMYLLLTVIAHFSLQNDNILETLRQFWFLILLPTLIIPTLAEWAVRFATFSIYSDKLSAFFLAIPVWIIYLNKLTKGIPKENQGFMMRFSHKYITFLAIFAMINIVILSSMSFAEIDALQTTGMDFSISLNTFKEFLQDTWEGMKDALRQTEEQIKRKTLGVLYRGNVEDAKEKTGLEITDFKTLGQKTKFIQGDTVEMLATIEARQLDKETKIKLNCYLEETSTYSANKIPGTINIIGNNEKDDVLVLDEYRPRETVSCRVHLNIPNMTGRYQAVLVGNLDYSSTAAVRYYFMEDKDIRAIQDQRKNINDYLEIPAIPWSETSNGPLTLRMSPDSVTNPISLSKEGTRKVFIGMYLDGGNVGTRTSKYGKIVKINSIELYVPKELSNLECLTGKPKGTYRIDDKTKYYVYSYESPSTTNSPTFEHGCYALISKEDTKKLLPEQNSLTDAYIFGNVDYNYEFRRMTPSFNVVSVGPQ